jgi:hypothetical protein
MCGGCGRRLVASAPAVGAQAVASSAHAYGNPRGSGSPGDEDAPTVADVAPVAVAPPRPRRTGTGARSPRPQWGAAPAWPSRRWGKASTVLIGLLIALLVLLLGGTAAWAAVLRPQLHQQIDGTLRSQLDTVVATVNAQVMVDPSQPNLTITRPVSAADVTGALQQQIPSGVPVQNVHVNFSDGRVIVSFTTNGFDGAVSTALHANNGRLEAVATEVDGPLALVESGDEMERTINAAMSKLRTDIKVKQVTLDKDVMTVAINGNFALTFPSH